MLIVSEAVNMVVSGKKTKSNHGFDSMKYCDVTMTWSG